ncbi:hypothetical protein BOCO_0658 [Bombiscardovia coagulans]|uniref:Uncharacterized protein n=1 Tax=Bombiscardovia coagulans TaxID=686666 RepID=A0A261ETF6_9BIFI|nr:hypothetical protein BOCO_0658 [Bombiscardovia coagulans]
MHGEHKTSSAYLPLAMGSSPHARGGTLMDITETGGTLRIIPACTGNTLPHPEVHGDIRDHPRMHGEHVNPIPESLSELGSSPHARGTRPARCY